MATNDNTASLFSEEELTRVMSGMDFKEDQPVTVLGITFDNDTKRREYFREELRKKLPELRNIEGFPLGSDDDIINLSDPPYFTACPNPWLNDFISQWEDEKKELQREGKRKPDFEVKEPYASDVSEGKNNPIYNAHSYHTKVPHPAIMRYILHYTQPGDVVYDGFAGTGMVGVAASKCCNPDRETKDSIEKDFKENGLHPIWGRRHSICGDLSPYASFIAYNYNTPTNPIWFQQEANRIIDEVEQELGWMYQTKHSDGSIGTISFVVWSDVFTCPHCGNEIVYYNEGVDNDKKEIREVFPCPSCGVELNKKVMDRYKISVYDKSLNKAIIQTKSVPVLIKYTVNGKRYEKTPDKEDLQLIEKINNLGNPYWFPTDKMMGLDGRWGEQWRSFHDGLNNVHHFFTARNLYIASAIYSRTIGKGVLNVMMTSYLVNIGSKMARYKMGKSGNVNMPGTLYVASATAEQNLFQGYRGKIKDFVKIYNMDSKGLVQVSSASNSSLEDNSIDYIFTDPPFGDNLMYSELNFIQESWLKVKTHNEEEAIVSSFYNKGVSEYQTLMQQCFEDYYRVLKPNHWITIEFSSTRAAVWNAIQRALQNVGFIIANVASIDKKQASYNAVTSTTAVKQDIVITCYKPSETFVSKINNALEYGVNVWDFIDEYLSHIPVHLQKNKSTTIVIERNPKILYDKVISYYVAHGLPVPINASDFQDGLRDRYIEIDGMFFNSVQAAEYEEKKKSAPDIIPMGIIVSDEANGIQWLKNQLQNNPKKYQDIYNDWIQAINGTRKNDIIPELKQILEENFIEDEGGKWRLPNIQDDKDVIALRTKALLREFKIYVETANKPKGKIKEARVEALRTGFKQCYIDKDFQTIVTVGDKIPQNLLTEDEVLLQFYDIAQNKL